MQFAPNEFYHVWLFVRMFCQFPQKGKGVVDGENAVAQLAGQSTADEGGGEGSRLVVVVDEEGQLVLSELGPQSHFGQLHLAQLQPRRVH